MSGELLVGRDGPILTLTINRPHDGNRVTSAMAVEITRTLGEAGGDVRLAMLRAAGEDFCHGWTGPGPGISFAGGMEAYESRAYYDVVFNCYHALRRATFPVIGAVSGRALGFGCALASACDITIAADTATFQIPEMGHNILPTMVMWALHDRVPYKALGYLAYTTTVIDAPRALSVGVVSEVVPAADLDAASRKIADFIVSRAAPSVLGLKEYLRSAPKMDAQGALDYARSLHTMVNTSSELKRQPGA